MSRQKSGLGVVKQCEQCGAEMYCPPSQAHRRRYCSAECKRLAVAARTTRTCARCGAEHQKSPSIVGKYCSSLCYQAARLRRTDCAVCGKVLVAKQAVYCSRECIAVGRTTLEERPCESCGKPMKVQPHQFGKRRACSRACNDDLKRIKGPGARLRLATGYISVYYPSHPNAMKDGRVLEHRLVMEKHIGRYLRRDEEINHINHVRDDNRIENLEIVGRGQHARESNAWGKKMRQNQRERLAEYERRFGPLD